jgi:hypothetical protein
MVSEATIGASCIRLRATEGASVEVAAVVRGATALGAEVPGETESAV